MIIQIIYRILLCNEHAVMHITGPIGLTIQNNTFPMGFSNILHIAYRTILKKTSVS